MSFYTWYFWCSTLGVYTPRPIAPLPRQTPVSKFYQLYLCYRDNSIVIRSSPSIISEVGSRKSEVGSRKSEVGRPFSAFVGTRLHDGLISQGHLWFWSNQRRSYHLNCKIKLQSRSLFSVLRLFRMFFLVWVWDILIREFEKKRKQGQSAEHLVSSYRCHGGRCPCFKISTVGPRLLELG